MVGGKIVLSAESPKTNPLEGRELKGHTLCCVVKQKRATLTLNQDRICIPPGIEGLRYPRRSREKPGLRRNRSARAPACRRTMRRGRRIGRQS